MHTPNGKRISTAELNRLRLQAVALRLRKVPLKQITLQTGLTPPTILSAYTCFLTGGWSAVHTGARGRPPGSRRAQPYPDLRAAPRAMMASKSSVPVVAPGEIEVRGSVQLTYRLQ